MNLTTRFTLSRAVLVALLASSAAACGGGDDKGSAKSAKPASSPAPAKTTAPAATTKPADAPPPKGDTPPPPVEAPAEKGTPPAAGHSDVPTVAEWQAVTGEVTVRGSSALGCETKGLREWVRISCRGDDPGRGSPLNVTVENAKGAETFKFASGGVSSLVYRFEEGTKIEATFSWTNGSHQFVAEWPPGAPKPTAYGVFE